MQARIDPETYHGSSVGSSDSTFGRDDIQTRVPGFNQRQGDYLDVVRGLGAQLVLIEHAGMYFLPTQMPGQLGNLGVSVFFLLSGFLIAGSVDSRLSIRRFTLLEFAVSRFTRIFLPYLPAIVLVAIGDSLVLHASSYKYAADYNWQTAIGNVLMLQDFPVFQLLRRLGVPDQPWFVREFGSGRQFWTISIEWWIYVAIGTGTAIVVSRRRPWWLMMLFAVGAIEPAYNLVAGPGNTLTGYWILGAITCLIYRRQRNRVPISPQHAWLLTCVLVAMASLRLLYTGFTVFDFIFISILCALMFLPVFALQDRTTDSMRPLSALRHLAFPSYSLYLTHNTFVMLIHEFGYTWLPGWRGFAISIVACNVVAIPFAWLFEKPHAKVRRRILRFVDRSQFHPTTGGADAGPPLMPRSR